MKAGLSLGLVLVALAIGGCAGKKESGAEQVQAKLAKLLPGLKPENVRPAQAAGLYEVQDGANFGYVTADGKYLITGDLVDLASGQSLTEVTRRGNRLAQLKTLGEQNMIVFPAQGAAKHVVTVFTDVDCGYCRKFHSQIADYNARGIEVRYVFYPRTGPDTDSFRKAEVVWCSADRKTALTEAKLGGAVNGNTQCDNPVRREWDLGNDLGLRGTPMLVLEDGSVVNGYLPPDALAQRLESPDSGGLAHRG
ncbi:thiol:disulfide interchange protein DsbC [Solimonas aquatica]|uniref:Thiol:disulfide interchange protein n=1 Tax=Solimonas aquatica TaxID=489703 RepID=A0A1H9MC51_9GAMM|nr:DsbC family protein [Solimonas aquatica]SER21276.1 thiol:disulfide interchange protein DsbC [Solimonas aquatica]